VICCEVCNKPAYKGEAKGWPRPSYYCLNPECPDCHQPMRVLVNEWDKGEAERLLKTMPVPSFQRSRYY
jgi:hypothetical protein